LPNIPLWQWVAGVLSQILRPGIAQTSSDQPFPSLSETAASAGAPEPARDRVISTYCARATQLQQQRDGAIIQRGKCSGYLFASLVALVASFVFSFRPHLVPPWVALFPAVAAMVAFEEVRKRDRRARDSVRLLGMYRRRLQRLEHEWRGKVQSPIPQSSFSFLKFFLDIIEKLVGLTCHPAGICKPREHVLYIQKQR